MFTLVLLLTDILQKLSCLRKHDVFLYLHDTESHVGTSRYTTYSYQILLMIWFQVIIHIQ